MAAGSQPHALRPADEAAELLLHGRFDEITPLKTEAEPLFKLLPEPKRIVISNRGHSPDPETLVPAVNTWLDETLGPVSGNH